MCVTCSSSFVAGNSVNKCLEPWLEDSTAQSAGPISPGPKGVLSRDIQAAVVVFVCVCIECRNPAIRSRVSRPIAFYILLDAVFFRVMYRWTRETKQLETTVLQAEIILLRDLILHLYTAYMVYLVITPTYFIISKTIERKGKPLVAKMNKSCFFFARLSYEKCILSVFGVGLEAGSRGV